MKDWLKEYGGPQKFQTGGAMEAPAAEGRAPAPEGQGGGANIEAMLAEYAQTRDPQLAVAICDMLIEMMAGQGGAGEGAPMARNGAKMSRGPVFKA